MDRPCMRSTRRTWRSCCARPRRTSTRSSPPSRCWPCSPRSSSCGCATASAGRSSGCARAGTPSSSRSRLEPGPPGGAGPPVLDPRRAEARHDARLAGYGTERVVVAGGHDGLAARAQEMLLTVEAQLRNAVDHAQQRVLKRLKAKRSLVREGLEIELGAIADGGGGGDQGSHCQEYSRGEPAGE